MNETMIGERLDLYPQHMFPRRFTAYGWSAGPRKHLSEERLRHTIVLVDVGSSGAFSEHHEVAWWKARDASLDQPMVQLWSDPLVLETRWDDFEDNAWKPTRTEAKKEQIGEFLEEVYQLGDLNDLQGATDRIFKYVDDLLLAGEFSDCNEVLERADVKRLPPALMRSFLTITAAAKEKLPARSAFYRDAFAEMVRLKGDADKAKRLLGRLA